MLIFFFFLNNISQLTAPSRGKALSVDFFFYYLVPPSPATFHCEQRATKKKKKKRMLIDYSKNPEYTFDLHSHAHKKKKQTLRFLERVWSLFLSNSFSFSSGLTLHCSEPKAKTCCDPAHLSALGEAVFFFVCFNNKCKDRSSHWLCDKHL